MSLFSRAACAVLLLGLAAPPSARADVALRHDLGGPLGFGTDCLSPNDDGSSAVIDLTPAFPSGLRFFGSVYTTAYVNTNGNLSFGAELSEYEPSAFPIAGQPIIAPYWADVDIRKQAGVCLDRYRGDRGCMNPPDNGVWWSLQPGLMVVTWHQVGYYDCHVDKRMSFQLILRAVESCGAGTDFDVVFRFNQCEWTTGDASGGHSGIGGLEAQAGFDAGNLTDFIMIPGSRMPGINTVMCTTSNIGRPGMWRFQIRGGTVVCPDAGASCDTGMPGVCGVGRTNCVGTGTSCVAEVSASAERCDGLDNDCNGEVDEGSDICSGALAICDRGRCVEPCFEAGCAEGLVCDATTMRCVDPGCAGVTCADGQRCIAGTCTGACDAVTCPTGRVCRAGRCVDPCGALTCDDCTTCIDGACIPRCASDSCPTGQACDAAGRCVDTACAMVTCAPGSLCVAGTCTDTCAGAVCPSGETCQLGECVAVAEPTRPDGGAPVARDAGATPAADAGGGAPSDVDGGLALTPPPTSTDSGCGCRVTRGARSRGPLALGALCALVLFAFSRRRHRRS